MQEGPQSAYVCQNTARYNISTYRTRFSLYMLLYSRILKSSELTYQVDSCIELIWLAACQVHCNLFNGLITSVVTLREQLICMSLTSSALACIRAYNALLSIHVVCMQLHTQGFFKFKLSCIYVLFILSCIHMYIFASLLYHLYNLFLLRTLICCIAMPCLLSSHYTLL